MTLYLLFAGLGLLIYTGVALAEAAGWRTRTVVVITLFACSAAILIGATREPGGAGIVSPHEPHVTMTGDDSTPALTVGRTLFQERGCVGCHRPDGTGVGPSLQGLFGSPVEYPGSAVATADESYLREAILNPLATVREGFPPIMPTTFAGQLTEEELQALIAYLTSLRSGSGQGRAGRKGASL
jgi:mono/diheme cytochrome c family protein